MQTLCTDYLLRSQTEGANGRGSPAGCSCSTRYGTGSTSKAFARTWMSGRLYRAEHSLQPELAVVIFKFRRRDDSRCRNAYGMQFAVQFGCPKFEKFVQYWKLRQDIV